MEKNKTEQITEYLRKKIYRHIDEINYKMPSEAMLCRLFNVSRITAKNAIEELTAQGLLFRHQGKGTFVASDAKTKVLQREELRSADLIALLLPDLNSKFMLDLIKGVEERLHSAHYNIIIKCTNYSQSQEQITIRSLIKNGVKGLIVYPVDRQFYNQEFLKLILKKFPLVLIDRTLKGLDVSVVASDHINDMIEATDYLIRNGHRNIGIISTSPDGTNTVEERIAGYEKALSANKISIKGSYKLTSLVNYDEQWEEKITNYFLQNKKLTAVITLNSDICYKTLRVLNKLNLEVPKHISLISYADDYSEIADLMKINLTSIYQNTVDIGRHAAEILVDQITDIDRRTKQLKIKSGFIIHNSTRSVLEQVP